MSDTAANCQFKQELAATRMSEQVLSFQVTKHREGWVEVTSPTGTGAPVERGRLYTSSGEASVHLQAIGLPTAAAFLAEPVDPTGGATAASRRFEIPYSAEAEKSLGLGLGGRRL